MVSVSALASMSDNVLMSLDMSGSASDLKADSADLQTDTVKSRYPVRKTDYPTGGEVVDNALDLSDPENLKLQTGDYDESTGMYKVGTKLGDNFLSAPYLMTPEDYLNWTEL